MSDAKRFTLTDADGRPHEYEVTPHPPSEGMEIMWRLVAFGAEPLGGAVKGLLAMGDMGSIAKLLDDPKGLQKLGKAVDFAALGRDVKASVQSTPMSDLTKAIVAKTTRDGQPLANALHFDRAYVCNYGELLAALWRVATINRFLSLPGM